MPISLAEIELSSIQNIKTDETQALVKHRIPGLEGDIIQDLGRRPTSISFEGIFKGEEALNNIESLRQKFKMREPIVFVADITDSADVTEVVIEDLRIWEVGGKPNHYAYAISLKEYVELVEEEVEQEIEEEQEQAAQESQAQQEQQIENEQVTLEVRVNLAEGETDYSNIIVEIYDERDVLKATLTEQTDGVYRKENLPPGQYKAIVKRL